MAKNLVDQLIVILKFAAFIRYNFGLRFDDVDEVDEIDEVYEVDEVDEVDDVDEVYEVDEVDEVDRLHGQQCYGDNYSRHHHGQLLPHGQLLLHGQLLPHVQLLPHHHFHVYICAMALNVLECDALMVNVEQDDEIDGIDDQMNDGVFHYKVEC